MQKNQRHYLAFLKVIKSFRLRKNISQKELAKKLNVYQSFISKYESGERQLDLLELRQICLVLGVPLSQFVAELEEELEHQYNET